MTTSTYIPQRNPPLRLPQHRLPGSIKPGQNLDPLELGQDPRDIVVELQQAPFHALQRRDAGHQLGAGRDPEDGIVFQALARLQRAQSGGLGVAEGSCVGLVSYCFSFLFFSFFLCYGLFYIPPPLFFSPPKRQKKTKSEKRSSHLSDPRPARQHSVSTAWRTPSRGFLQRKT